MANIAYATTTDLAEYLPGVAQTEAAAVWTTFLNSASRFLDDKLGQHFYDDGYYTRYFDGGDGEANITVGRPFYGASGTIAACALGATSLTYSASPLAPAAPQVGDTLTLDIGSLQEQVAISNVSGTGPYVLTTAATQYGHAAATGATTIEVKLAYFENQPIAEWVTILSGDGVTPPSNYFLWPRQRGNAGSSLTTNARAPWYGLDIAHIPISQTTYLPSSIPGYLTVAITAHWGWPAVPDILTHITCKMAARAWRARDSGWSEVLGATDIGVVKMFQHFDPSDEYTLLSSGLTNTVY